MKTLEILKKYNIALKKSLGQNYLLNENIPKKMVNFSKLDDSFTCIEIGTGLGILTLELSKYVKNVISFEIDRRLNTIHRDLLDKKNITIKYEDFLKTNLNIFEGKKIAYIANIPYNITSPILEKIFSESPKFEFIVLMVQKEFAQRMNAKEGTKAYGAMTVNLNSQANIENGFTVKPDEFIPKPKVESFVIKLIPDYKVEKMYFNEFRKFVNLCFSQRRKKLKNNLKKIMNDPENLLNSLSIGEDIRAEKLKTEEFKKLFFAYKKTIH